jgi:hypothetical protein
MCGAIPPLPQYVFMAWGSVSTRTTLYFLLCYKHILQTESRGVIVRIPAMTAGPEEVYHLENRKQQIPFRSLSQFQCSTIYNLYR